MVTFSTGTQRGGSDLFDGLTRSTAKATFCSTEELCAVSNHDIIFAIANDTGGVTTYTTPITISKDTVKLRGPGYQFQLIPSSSVNNTLIKDCWVDSATSKLK